MTALAATLTAVGIALAASAVTAPTITSQPANPTNQTSAHFTYSDSQTGVTYQCQLDGSAFASCPSSGITYPGPLASGSHTFKVQALAGTKTSSAATYTWTIDRTVPVVSSINRVAANPTSAANVSWSVTFSESVTGVDAGDFQPAGSGLGGSPVVSGVSGSGSTYTIFASTGSGSGTLGLNVVDNDSIKDLAGNPLGGPGTGNGNFTGQVYTIDRTPPPAPQITAHPPVLVSSTGASFSFVDSEGGVTFVCKLDSGAPAVCSTPKAYAGLSQGSHTFQVQARDALGNLSTAGSWTWTVDTQPPPAPTITQHPTDPTSSSSASFAFADTETGVIFECKLDSGEWALCTSPTTYSALSAAEHNFYVRAVDQAGNRSGAARFEWDVKQATGMQFTISGNASGLLYPGAPAMTLAVKLANPNSVPIFVTSLTSTLQSGSLPSGCSASGFQVTQSTISTSQTVQVPASGSVTLPAQGASAPMVQMLDTNTNQNACRNATISFTYSGSAHS